MTNERKHPVESDQQASQNRNGVYEIKVKGLLDEHWKSWFEGMTLRCATNGEPRQEYTLITGPIVDQPALHGLLAKIRDLNLILISVREIRPDESETQEKTRGQKTESGQP